MGVYVSFLVSREGTQAGSRVFPYSIFTFIDLPYCVSVLVSDSAAIPVAHLSTSPARDASVSGTIRLDCLSSPELLSAAGAYRSATLEARCFCVSVGIRGDCARPGNLYLFHWNTAVAVILST